jgi:protease I
MKALIILIPEGFRDEEFAVPRDLLKKAGFSVTVAGLAPGESKGARGMKATPEKLLSEIKDADYDAIILPGGGGAKKHLFNNREILDLIRRYNDADKIVAAICLSGAVLANAGILSGRNATVFSTPETISIFKRSGVFYMGDGVFSDGNIITASGPEYAEEFAQKIVEMLKTREK